MRSTPMLIAALAVAASLAACGDNGKPSAAENQRQTDKRASSDSPPARQPAPRRGDEKHFKYSIADGVDICFKKIREKLGAGAKVMSIGSRFSAGPSISDSQNPRGVLDDCSVDYQDPDNPNQLLRMSMDSATGEFGKPRHVEISVHGDASKFVLDSVLMPLGKVDTGWIQAFMDKKTASVGKVFKEYAWTKIILEEPDMLSKTHRFRISVHGRYKTNDLKDSGLFDLTLDGKQSGASKNVQ